jgi:hypothetical protein
MRSRLAGALAAVALVAGCTGSIGDHVNPDVEGVGTSGLRRLTQHEMDNVLRDLLGDETRSGAAFLPEDSADPFDNDRTTQQPSGALVEAVERLATQAADRAMDDPARRAALVPCAPSGADDAACLEAFVRSFGRRALRRPLADDEVSRYLTLQAHAVEAGDFYRGVALVIQALLQHPEFLYRVEIGTPVKGRPGLHRLNDFEVATRLSFFFWGSTPDDELLDLAEARGLRTQAQLREAAARMVDDPRARARVERFHALWLGYSRLPHAQDLTNAMRTETAALVERVIFDERRTWLDLFRLDETFVGDLLAGHYGLPLPGSEDPVWVPYGDSGRLGILSHGSFLSVAGKFGDTSPTQRGLLIATRLLCKEIPPPPPDVNVDEPPVGADGDCKYDRYAAHRQLGSCAGCHVQMDPIGFGLENYDQAGRWRAHDEGAPECLIEGEGELVELGATFRGPAELGEILATSGLLEHCLITQVYRFAMGQREGEEDAPYVAALAASFGAHGRFDQLMVDLAAEEAFGYRREEP